MVLTFSDLRLRAVSYAVRYGKAWLIWDRAGAVATSLQDEFPTLTLTQATPGNVGVLATPNIAVSLGIDRCAVSGFRLDKDLVQFKRISQVVTELLMGTFSISSFS